MPKKKPHVSSARRKARSPSPTYLSRFPASSQSLGSVSLPPPPLTSVTPPTGAIRNQEAPLQLPEENIPWERKGKSSRCTRFRVFLEGGKVGYWGKPRRLSVDGWDGLDGWLDEMGCCGDETRFVGNKEQSLSDPLFLEGRRAGSLVGLDLGLGLRREVGTCGRLQAWGFGGKVFRGSGRWLFRSRESGFMGGSQGRDSPRRKRRSGSDRASQWDHRERKGFGKRSGYPTAAAEEF